MLLLSYTYPFNYHFGLRSLLCFSPGTDLKYPRSDSAIVCGSVLLVATLPLFWARSPIVVSFALALASTAAVCVLHSIAFGAHGAMQRLILLPGGSQRLEGRPASASAPHKQRPDAKAAEAPEEPEQSLQRGGHTSEKTPGAEAGAGAGTTALTVVETVAS